MIRQELASVAKSLVAPGKGILAADESLPTIEKRFVKINLASTEENRRAYREVLITIEGMEDYISGVILFDETIRQKTKDGIPFPDVLSAKSVIPGIKVDQGTEELLEFPGEKITKGLATLAERLKEYKDLGVLFTKWRAVYTIGPKIPSGGIIERNAEALAQYALISQQAGLVPIVEPEVLMDGAHSIQKCEEVTTKVLTAVFKKLQEKGVDLSGMLLKPNMVLPGKDSGQKATPLEVAEATIRTLRNTVPTAVPGIVFLSGGQTPEQATGYLNEMNRVGGLPWQLSFSFGRALQDPVLKTWNGRPGNVVDAQKAFLKRARLNSFARFGEYNLEMENG
ncbi:MAG: fructose-bisphosphate aldolase class I [Candidatus Chisholmbacteria bacterium]|nr:fructose-bisphosphate aldolase class I [Candidatus Chisholmbacteria bacterium]